jgi:acetolactate synthase-1/2/3 large subunit
VLIDMPKDVSNTLIDPTEHTDFHLPGYNVPAQGDSRDIELAAVLLQQARRPVLLVGHGAVLSGAEEEVRGLAETLGIPVTNTLLGKGCFPETHELSLGMLGMHGTAYANLAVQHCDLIMSVGSRWDDRIVGKLEEFCSHARKIHVDIDPAEINKTVQVDCAVIGDARLVLQSLLPLA